ncbi:hypothetical protein VCHA52P453_110132 [Vibrio chagasii]|nr:hypothetical protein THOG10_100028 [Vibrio rotiferianus]CAH1559548.1 hypothetical protein THOB06_100028 [Vibrio rotiferianus]CAH6940220.1 hypothetical protein VCHA39P226_120132 [Vibrio chagasii]CAH6940939.1 hypothetical protein VCHA52P453_110132 [Vibrio chagasii]CAH7311114.1 hypothetical protein VCHA52P456_40131 [Vibrio chagasii]
MILRGLHSWLVRGMKGGYAVVLGVPSASTNAISLLQRTSKSGDRT